MEVTVHTKNNELIIETSKDFSEFSEYLIYGLDFKRSDSHFSKSYTNQNNLRRDLNEIYSDNSSDISFKFDEFCLALINSVQQENQSLEQSVKFGEAINNGKRIKLDLPANFYRLLKPFQIKSVAHIVNVKNSANFSVPGSGKTTISLAAYSILKEKQELNKLLVVSPFSAFKPWEDEYKECFAREPKSARISGLPSDRKDIFVRKQEYELFLITYAMLKYEKENLIDLLKSDKFFMILDESHHIKRFEGGLHSNIVIELSNLAKKRLILSGTPVPNSLTDLWSQFTFLWPGRELLGTKRDYKENLNEDKIREKISPLFVRITKDELNIPKPSINRVKIKLSEEHYNFYNALINSISINAKSKTRLERRDLFRSSVAWIIQAADDPNLLFKSSTAMATLSRNTELIETYKKYKNGGFSQKLELLRESIKNRISKGEKIILWTYFVNNIKMLSETLLKEFDPLLIYGEVPTDSNVDINFNRELNLQKFKTDPTKLLLIANPAACAESISLQTVCKHAIYLDRTFNCAQYMQSIDRIHRIGITESPKVDLFIANDTIDEVVDDRLEEKTQIMLKLLKDPFIPLNLETTAEDMFGNINSAMGLQNEKDLEAIEKVLGGIK